MDLTSKENRVETIVEATPTSEKTLLDFGIPVPNVIFKPRVGILNKNLKIF